MPLITLLTDFGCKDPYVGVMKGQILGHCPQAQLIDLTHEVEPQDVAGAAFQLAKVQRWFPDGTVHLVVVDPGVGSRRAAVAARAWGQYFVGPDNGVLYPSLQAADYQVVQLDVPEGASKTFHGRDVFAPAAARLAAGAEFESLGEPFGQLQELILDTGRVLWIDHFGNLITGIKGLDGEDSVKINGYRVPVVKTYVDVPEGQPLALWGSDGHLEISVNRGSAADFFQARPGLEVQVG